MILLLTCQIFETETEYDSSGYEKRKYTIVEDYNFELEVKPPVDFDAVKSQAKEIVWENTGCHMVDGTLRMEDVK